MADCSAAGTTIDRAARAVLGGANSASSSMAGKHVGALLGHTAMSMSMSAAVPSMPLVSPDRLTLPLRQQHQQAQAQPQPQPTVSSQRQNQYNPMMMQHSGSAVATRNLPVQQFHQQQQIHQQQQMHQHQIQMQLQMQQQQQAITMMLHQQQQQQQLMKRHQQQQLDQSKVDAGNIEQQEHQQQNGDWHDGLEEEFLREQDALGDGVFDDLEDIRAITGGAGIEELAAAWADAEAEYDNVLSDYDDQQQQGQQQEGDGNVLVDDDDYANLWQGDNTMSLHTPKPYNFVNRPVEDATTTAPYKNYMEEGMKNFQEGNIKEAIESFEMELQVQNTDNAVAWRMLGKCHAENDQDPEAIQCLEAAVDRDPFCPEALLALGVSYVNELNHEKALENMKAWFTHNPKYAGMELPARNSEEDIYGAAAANTIGGEKITTDEENITDSHRTAKESAFDEVKSMLLAALAFDPTSTDTADVYEALGVIYNVIKDYDAAIDAFRKALESRPNDHQLWNKLGATLANGSQSEQALPTYHQSLKLKPKYARAWLNMAISHSNLQDHDEAARCYLQTLSLNPGATHCWTYLRMSLSSKERWDLLPLVFERNLSGFQEQFDFVLY
jgi:peroxin-5